MERKHIPEVKIMVHPLGDSSLLVTASCQSGTGEGKKTNSATIYLMTLLGIILMQSPGLWLKIWIA